MNRESLRIVITGHVDHGKSTVLGRLLADTGSLPEGKLEAVKQTCLRNSKPFEYAFLLDALKDEQSQGITIDIARCFFKTEKRDYIVMDAPGHIEFLKNMVTGAARAEAAILTIDAHEGIRENSKRHGYLVSMLGIKQVSIAVNKMDLVNFDKKVFDQIVTDFTQFLAGINVVPVSFIPISAREGDNIISKSENTPWYDGPSILQQLDAFKTLASLESLPLRFPVQDIYKFTEENDSRRIFAGNIETGTLASGDKVVFYPSGKASTVQSIEEFNTPLRNGAVAGEAIGVTLTEQIYLKPGELMAKATEVQPLVSSRFRVNVFWMGKAPMIKNKNYKLKLGASRAIVKLADVINVLDASELSASSTKQQIDRHDVADCILETAKPIAFDMVTVIEQTGRFVIVDNYEIAGGGIVLGTADSSTSTLKEHVRERELAWERSGIDATTRAAVYKHRGKFVVITGANDTGKRDIAKALEKQLFDNNYKAYYLGVANIAQGLDADIAMEDLDREEQIRRLGELARIMTDAGLIFITTISNTDDYDLEKLKLLNAPHEILTVNIGQNELTRFKVDVDIPLVDAIDQKVEKIIYLLKNKDVLVEYCI